jgi:hypothetical protein
MYGGYVYFFLSVENAPEDKEKAREDVVIVAEDSVIRSRRCRHPPSGSRHPPKGCRHPPRGIWSSSEGMRRTLATFFTSCPEDAKKGGSDPRNVGEDHKKPCEDLRLVTSFLDIVRGLPQNMRAGGGDRTYGWSREALAFFVCFRVARTYKSCGCGHSTPKEISAFWVVLVFPASTPPRPTSTGRRCSRGR